MKKLNLILALLAIFMMSALPLAVADDDDDYNGALIRVPKGNLDIDVWVDRGNGATYHPGDDIRIH